MSSTSNSPPDQMTAIAAMDTETSLFFDHRDPDQVGRLGAARLDI